MKLEVGKKYLVERVKSGRKDWPEYIEIVSIGDDPYLPVVTVCNLGKIFGFSNLNGEFRGIDDGVIYSRITGEYTE